MPPFTAAQEFLSNRPRVVLDGVWQFAYDPTRAGRRDRWFDAGRELPERIGVPGCPQARRYASAQGGPLVHAGLPETQPGAWLRYPCAHDAWFKRAFTLPTAWRGRDVWLRVGGVLPAAEFWLNGVRLGATATSRSPVRCRLPKRLVRWNGPNTLTVRVYHAERTLNGLFDTTGWCGLYRSLWLEATDPAHFVDVHIRTDIHRPTAKFRITLARPAGAHPFRLGIFVHQVNGPGRYEAEARVPAARAGTPQTVAVRVPMPGATLWSPEQPALYRVEITLGDPAGVRDKAVLRFGLREIRARGFHVLLNDRPVFLRGGCDDHLYPQTVCPPADTAFFRKRIAQAQRCGFNYTKSAVEIFTPEFLDAADELGYLVCQEMPLGITGEPRARRHDPPPWLQALGREQTANIVRASRHHPSVVIYSMASELPGEWAANPASFRLFSRELPAVARRLHPEALIFDCTGESRLALNDGHEAIPVRIARGRRATDLQGSWMRFNEQRAPLSGPLPGLGRTVTKPFILHEYTWMTCLSDPGLARRMRRSPILPLHVPDMIRAARAQGQGLELQRLFEVSRQLKRALVKDAWEAARGHAKVAGYHHWLVHDFPFCAEGVLNEFWEPPPDLPAAAVQACNGDTVLLLEDRGRRDYEAGERPPLALRVSHFGPRALERAEIRWSLRASRRRPLARGVVALGPMSCGRIVASQPLDVRLPATAEPQVIELQAELRDAGRRVCENRWSLWVVPAVQPGEAGHDAAGVRLTERLDDDTLQRLADGGRVLYLAPVNAGPAGTGWPRGGGAPLYRTIPYNQGTDGNMGTLIRDHPALGGFPHQGWCDFCFVPLIQGAQPLALAPFGPGRVQPIIRSIGHMRTLADKAYLFEAAVGRGRLLACSLRLREYLDRSPTARYLLRHMLEYLGGPMRPRPAAIDLAGLRQARV